MFTFITRENSISDIMYLAGVAHQPYTVDSIPVLAGQRYSVVVSHIYHLSAPFLHWLP